MNETPINTAAKQTRQKETTEVPTAGGNMENLKGQRHSDSRESNSGSTGHFAKSQRRHERNWNVSVSYIRRKCLSKNNYILKRFTEFFVKIVFETIFARTITSRHLISYWRASLQRSPFDAYIKMLTQDLRATFWHRRDNGWKGNGNYFAPITTFRHFGRFTSHNALFAEAIAMNGCKACIVQQRIALSLSLLITCVFIYLFIR